MQGLRIERDGAITIHIFSDSSDVAVATWAESAAQIIDETPPDQSFLLLLDVSAPQVSFTRYARQKSQILFTRYRQRHGRFALLFSSRIAPYYTRIFFTSLGRLDFDLACFSNREQALHWLRDGKARR